QFADFHSHGWVFRAVYKKDWHGNYLDHRGKVLSQVGTRELMCAMKMPELIKEQYRDPPQPAPNRDCVPVHLMDVHLEKGMHCVDCHFIQDVHGNTKLYGEVRAAIEIQCVDCHGSVTQRATLKTSGPASDTSGPNGRNLEGMSTPFGKRRFERRGGGTIVQNSMVE